MSFAIKKPRLIVMMIIAVLAVGVLIGTQRQLERPSQKTKQDMAWLELEANKIFDKYGQLRPKKVTYICDIPQKISGGCYIETHSPFLANTTDIDKYVSLGELLSAQLTSSGWKMYSSRYPSSEISTNTQGKKILNLYYTKSAATLYCELSYTVENGVNTGYPGDYATWHIRCR